MQNYSTRAALFADPEMKDRYEQEYTVYTPEQESVKQLGALMTGKKAIVVLGTWCSDSQQLLPRFYKILDEAGIEEEMISLICVDRSKIAADGSTDNLSIEHVPTFIFTANDQEIGRITESPITTLENDMVTILSENACQQH